VEGNILRLLNLPGCTANEVPLHLDTCWGMRSREHTRPDCEARRFWTIFRFKFLLHRKLITFMKTAVLCSSIDSYQFFRRNLLSPSSEQNRKVPSECHRTVREEDILLFLQRHGCSVRGNVLLKGRGSIAYSECNFGCPKLAIWRCCLELLLRTFWL
jgi:hypothetical protein